MALGAVLNFTLKVAFLLHRQPFQSDLSVLLLQFSVLANYGEAGGKMRHPHGARGRVHVLSSGPGRSKRLELQFRRIQGDLYLRSEQQNCGIS